jgi:hypothetical protein
MYILDGLHMDVKYNVALWPLSHLNIKYDMFTNCDLIQYFQNEVTKILCLKIEFWCVFFLKCCKDEIHKCHWVIVLSHCILSKTHLSTLKLTSINGKSFIFLISCLHEIMLYKWGYDDELHWDQMLNSQQ